jgi:hypothetical protein
MNEQLASRILENAFKLWFEPEVKKRLADGRLKKGAAVWAVQVVLTLEADPDVRLNQEVRGAFVARPSRKVESGEVVLLEDIRDIESMQLTNEDPNAGHFTAVVHNGRWHIFFDFRYNATRIQTQLEAADQFIAAAASAIERGHDIAAVDNLYNAVQMMAKSYLLTTGDQRVLESKTHGFIETGFNRQAKIGNVDAGAAKLLNRLARLRPKTRYALEPHRVASSELEWMLADARTMREGIERRRPKRARR